MSGRRPIQILDARWSVVLLTAVVLLPSWMPPSASAQEPPGNSAVPSRPARYVGELQLIERWWDSRDGLPQNSVTAIAETPDGNLWLGTFGGLVRFNGFDFDVFDLATSDVLRNPRVISLCLDSMGRLWVGTESGGIYQFDMTEEEFIIVQTDTGEPQGHVSRIVEGGDGTIWFATDSGLFAWTEQGLTPRFVGTEGAKAITTVEVVGDELWVGTTTGVLRFADGGVESLAVDLRPLPVHNIAARDDTVWVTHALGVVVFSQRASRLTRVIEWPNVRWSGDTLITDDAVFVATDGIVYILARDGLESARKLDHEVNVRVLHMDREGSLWIGTDGRGLLQWRPRELVKYDESDGLPYRSVLPVIEGPDGAIYMGSGCGTLTRLEDGIARTVDVGVQLECVRSMMVDRDDNLWVGHAVHVDRLDSAGPTRMSPSEGLGENVLALEERVPGEIWMGTAGAGVTVRHPTGQFVTFTTDDGLVGNHVMALVADEDGGLWLGTRSGASYFHDGEFVNYGADSGISRGPVRSIHLDAMGVWFGTYGGGLSIRRHDGHFVRLTRDDGLFDNVVSRILVDDLGFVWMNGNRGVFRVPYHDIVEVVRGKRTRVQSNAYDSGEGFGGAQPAGWRDRRGVLWFPTIHGLVRIDPAQITRNEVSPVAVIERALLDNRPLDDVAPDEAVERADLEIKYAARTFVRPDEVTYRYRLVGYDNQWTEAGTRRVARYTGLPPGRYRFEVSAANSHGVWAKTPTALPIVVVPHFWQTWWFMLGGLVVVVVVALGVHRYRLMSVRAHNRALQAEMSERRRAEQAVRRSVRHYRTIFETTTNAIFLLQRDGQVLDANPAAAELLEAGRDELRDRPLLALTDQEDAELLREALVKAHDGDEAPTSLAVRFLRPSGVAHAEVAIVPFALETGRFVLLVASDVTARMVAEREQRILEDRLSRAQRMEALGRLAGGISHDFNNILTAIIGHAQLLDRELERGDAQLRELSQEILDSAMRASALTTQLLAFGRREVLEPEAVDMAELLAKLDRMLARLVRADIHVRVSVAPDTPAVLADPSRIEQVVVNLVLNAADAIDGSGNIVVEVEPETVDESRSMTSGPLEAGRWVRLMVADDGSGIEEEILPRIFEPFVTTKAIGHGTGLGLASVHGIVRQAGGAIHVESSSQGTRFSVYLMPALEPQVAEAESLVANESSPHVGGIVIVCDDNPVVLKTVRRILQRRGLALAEANHPSEAVQLARQHRGAIRLLITDVMMPDMRGPALAREVWSLQADVPVLYMSGYTADIVVDLEDDDRVAFVAKPFDVTRFTTHVNGLLARDSSSS